MSDPGRLRQAADVLETLAVEAIGEDGPVLFGLEFTVANLLRALADAVWVTTEITSSASSPAVREWGPGPVHTAAMALADIVLGDTDG